MRPPVFSSVTGNSTSGAETLNEFLPSPHLPIANGYPTYSVLLPVSRNDESAARISLLYCVYSSDSPSHSSIRAPPHDNSASITAALRLPSLPHRSIALPATGLDRYSMRLRRLILVSRDCRFLSVSFTSARIIVSLTGFCSPRIIFKNPMP